MRPEEQAALVRAKLLGKVDGKLTQIIGDHGQPEYHLTIDGGREPVKGTTLAVEYWISCRSKISAFYVGEVRWRLGEVKWRIPGDPATYRVIGILSK